MSVNHRIPAAALQLASLALAPHLPEYGNPRRLLPVLATAFRRRRFFMQQNDNSPAPAHNRAVCVLPFAAVYGR